MNSHFNYRGFLGSSAVKYCLSVAAALILTACASTAELTAQLHSERAAHRTAIETARQQSAIAEARAFETAMKHADGETARMAVFGLAMSKQARELVNGGRADLDPLPHIEGWDDKLLRFAGIVLPAAVNVTGQVMQYRLGSKQAEYGRDIALGDQQARVDTVRAVGDIATGGFNALATVGGQPSSVVNITGNGNAANGSTADNSTTTTTSTNNCHSGNGGSGVPGSASGNSRETGNSSQASTGTTGAQSGTVNCGAGK